MQTIDDLFAAFGGMLTFSATTGIKYPTVTGFKARNSVPDKHWKTIEAHAKAQGIEGIDRYTIADLMLRKYPDVVIKVPSKAKARPRPAARVAEKA